MMNNFINDNIFNNNSFLQTDLIDTNLDKKNDIACFLETALKDAVKKYNKSNNIEITDADIMFKNGQIFVGCGSIKFDYIK